MKIEVTHALKSKNMPKDEFLELIGKTIDKHVNDDLETIARVLNKKCKSVSTDNVSKGTIHSKGVSGFLLCSFMLFMFMLKKFVIGVFFFSTTL